MREWKPGDVAMVTGKGGGNEVIAVRQGNQWATQNARYLSDFQVTARPLVVIDPEDPEQVEALQHAFREAAGWVDVWDDQRVEALTAALRSLVADPEPDEPQGLGAVVEDEHGQRWVRTPAGRWVGGFGATNGYAYATLSAVKVLSEGVS